jgi:hypothetical protein
VSSIKYQCGWINIWNVYVHFNEFWIAIFAYMRLCYIFIPYCTVLLYISWIIEQIDRDIVFLLKITQIWVITIWLVFLHKQNTQIANSTNVNCLCQSKTEENKGCNYYLPDLKSDCNNGGKLLLTFVNTCLYVNKQFDGFVYCLYMAGLK